VWRFTLNAYIHARDAGLDSADAWDGMIASTRGHPGATEHPDTAANDVTSGHTESAAQREIGAGDARGHHREAHVRPLSKQGKE
jgi:hypothetical protein